MINDKIAEYRQTEKKYTQSQEEYKKEMESFDEKTFKPMIEKKLKTLYDEYEKKKVEYKKHEEYASDL